MDFYDTEFVWDLDKEQKNIHKHGISFRIAKRVFDDPNHVERTDKKHSVDEERLLAIGRVDEKYILVTVVFTERGELVRIISARIATKREEEEYYGGA